MGQRAGAAAPGADAVNAVDLETLLGPDLMASLDLFDRMQLAAVIGICRNARPLSEAGRKLFNRTREQRTVVNDADRLRKYLMKHGLSWESMSS